MGMNSISTTKVPNKIMTFKIIVFEHINKKSVNSEFILSNRGAMKVT